MNHTEALDKVRKLLRLAQSNNPNEAALAAARAQDIIDRYKLSIDALDSEASNVQSQEPVEDFSHDPLEQKSGGDRWRSTLAVNLCRLHQCRVLLSRGKLQLYGRASDVQTIRYFYGWIVRETERLAAANCRGTGRTYWNNFRLGVIDTVSQRLSDQARATREAVRLEARQKDEAAGLGELFAHSNKSALVLVEKAIANVEQRKADVDLYIKQKFPRLRSGGTYRTTFHSGAREAGRRAGHSINLAGRSAGSLNGQQRHLNR